VSKVNEKIILHCDLNNFFATATLIDKPEYSGKPVAIAGDVSKRHGIILAKNMPAKLQGVKTAEPIWQAMQKCPELVTLRPEYQRYIEYSETVRKIYDRFTGNIEPFGIDECWLDISKVTSNENYGKEIAYEIKETIKRETSLTVSVGVSFSKTFAKLGSDYKKPDAVTVISKQNYRCFVWPMPVRALLCVGRKTEQRLLSISITTIGDLANASDHILIKLLGKNGLMLKDFANGRDSSFVKPVDHAFDFKGMGNSMTTTHDLTTHSEVFSSFLLISEMIAKRMMDKKVCAYCLAIHLKDSELQSVTRQKKLESPIFISDEITEICMKLYMANWDISERHIRAIGIRVTDFTHITGKYQRSFFDSPNTKKKANLEFAKKNILDKYGKGAIKRAAFMIDETPKAKGYKEQHTVHPLSFFRK
jgi:DNA polymerase IV